MTPDKKALTLGILIGILLSITVFAGGILVWIQLSSTDLKVPANQFRSITIGDMTFNFSYHPDSQKLFINGTDAPSKVGFGGSFGGSLWGSYRITEVTPGYVVLHFKPWRFTSIQDVTQR
jgi:hypothetical protein